MNELIYNMPGTGPIQAFQDVRPNTLIRFPAQDAFGVWFRQEAGVVGPNGQVPVVFGNPEVEIAAEVQHEPGRQADRWKRRNPAEVAIYCALTRWDGTSWPTRTEDVRHSLKYKAEHLAKLKEMEEAQLIVEGYQHLGLSIHSKAEMRYHLTSIGMAMSVVRGIRREDHESSAKRGRKLDRLSLSKLILGPRYPR